MYLVNYLYLKKKKIIKFNTIFFNRTIAINFKIPVMMISLEEGKNQSYSNIYFCRNLWNNKLFAEITIDFKTQIN